jgi:putative oxidoreductase
MLANHMQLTILAAFFEASRTVVSMCSAGILVFIIALWAARDDIARARSLDKIVALSNLCFAVPLAVFGALHLAAAQALKTMVPSYMPWPLFWAYFFGFALLAASLSIATRIQVRWSGLLFGIAMFCFVAMMDIPGALATPGDRFGWILAIRELAFGAGAWLLAAGAMTGTVSGAITKSTTSTTTGQVKTTFLTLGRVVVGITAIFYGVEFFLHPQGVPALPLQKMMPDWIPAHLLINYLTGAILVVSGAAILLAKKTRLAATYLGTWIVLLVVFIYGPILISALANPSTEIKIEGINYFFDTLLFAGVILALASATPPTD